MKKFLSILLVITMIIGLSACSFMSDEDKNKLEDIKDAISDFEEDLKEEIEEDANKVKEPFSYKMAKVYEKPYNEDDYYKSELVYVIEFNVTGYHALEFNVFTKDGKNIEELETGDCDIRLYKGGVCVKDDIDHVDDFDLLNEDHKLQYIVVVSAEEDIFTFDDLVIKSEVYYEFDTESKEEVAYELNAELSEITTKQKYLHTNSLVNLDGVYYIFDNNAGVGGNSHLSYRAVDLELIGENPLSSLNGKIEWVDKDGNVIDIPNGCKFHFEFDEDEYEIGLSSADEKTELTEEQDDIGYSGFLKYTDRDGFTTIFFSA